MPVDASEHGPCSGPPQRERALADAHPLRLWGLYFVYVLWRFSAKRNPKASYHGVQSHFSTYTEAGVAVVEVILLVGFSIPMWYRWTHVPPPSSNPLEMRIVAEQFAWNIQYPGPDGVFGRRDVKLVTSSNPLGLDLNDPHAKDDIVTLNELHLEVNRPVIIHVTSKDVIHSFKLPVMRVETGRHSGNGDRHPLHAGHDERNERRATSGRSPARSSAASATTACAARCSSTPKPIQKWLAARAAGADQYRLRSQ